MTFSICYTWRFSVLMVSWYTTTYVGWKNAFSYVRWVHYLSSWSHYLCTNTILEHFKTWKNCQTKSCMLTLGRAGHISTFIWHGNYLEIEVCINFQVGWSNQPDNLEAICIEIINFYNAYKSAKWYISCLINKNFNTKRHRN